MDSLTGKPLVKAIKSFAKYLETKARNKNKAKNTKVTTLTDSDVVGAEVGAVVAFIFY
jgi:hypothetical protein